MGSSLSLCCKSTAEEVLLTKIMLKVALFKTIVVRDTKTLTQIMAQLLTSKDKQLGKAALLESSRK